MNQNEKASTRNFHLLGGPANNILELIGNTPMVRINELNPNPDVSIYAKLEGNNPGRSIKDRIALKMIEQAEEEGKLTNGKTIIEPTSGNTGISLALIGAVKGYHVEIVMSEAVSIERRRMIQAFGATTTLTDRERGTDGAIVTARELVEEHPDEYFMPDQFSNKWNKITHYRTTAEEIWYQLNGKVDYFVSGIGTSGTIMGVGQHLRERNPDVRVVCAYPVKGHYIQGLKNMTEAIVPALYDPSKIDEFVNIENEPAFDLTRRLAKYEGIFAGQSSGAAMYAALEVAKKAKHGNIVVILPDGGDKYLSTGLFKF